MSYCETTFCASESMSFSLIFIRLLGFKKCSLMNFDSRNYLILIFSKQKPSERRAATLVPSLSGRFVINYQFYFCLFVLEIKAINPFDYQLTFSTIYIFELELSIFLAVDVMKTFNCKTLENQNNTSNH